MATGIKLAREVYERIIRHCHAEIPREAVGLIGGNEDGCGTISIVLPNLAGPQAFLADPFAQFEAERRLTRSNLHLIGIYHSHPGGGPHLSPRDVAFARVRPCAHIVIALDRPYQRGEEMRAYWVRGESVSEAEIRIVSGW